MCRESDATHRGARAGTCWGEAEKAAGLVRSQCQGWAAGSVRRRSFCSGLNETVGGWGGHSGLIWTQTACQCWQRLCRLPAAVTSCSSFALNIPSTQACTSIPQGWVDGSATRTVILKQGMNEGRQQHKSAVATPDSYRDGESQAPDGPSFMLLYPDRSEVSLPIWTQRHLKSMEVRTGQEQRKN